MAAPLAASSVSLVSDSRAPGHWAAGLLAAVAVVHLALVGRRTWPLASFVVITFAVLVLGVAPDLTVAPGAGSGAGREGTAFAPILLPSSAVFFVALYGVAAYGRRLVPGVGLTVGVLGAGVVTARLAQVAPGTTLGGPVQIGFVLAALLAAVGAAWGLGLFRRMRSAYVHALEEEARRADELRAERARAGARGADPDCPGDARHGGAFAGRHRPAGGRRRVRRPRRPGGGRAGAGHCRGHRPGGTP